MLRSSVSGKVKQNQRIGLPSGSPALCFEQLRGARARSNLVDLVACARGRARSIPGQREFSV